MNRPNNVVPLHRSVRPIDLERAARACGELPDLIEALRQNEKRREPTRLVSFFRENGNLFVGICIGICFGCLLITTLAYFIRGMGL